MGPGNGTGAMKNKNRSRFLWAAILIAGLLSLTAAAPQSGHAGPLQLAQEVTPEATPPLAGEDTSEDEKIASDEAFERFKETLAVINENIASTYGGPPFVKIENPSLRTVKITPSKKWMEIRERHQRNAMMLYRMWRNANQFRPVTLIIVDDTGADYLTLMDTPTGPEFRARQY